MSAEETERICGNCAKFLCPFSLIKATDVKTSEVVASGRRNCSARNIAWADSPCVTNEFVEKKTEPIT